MARIGSRHCKRCTPCAEHPLHLEDETSAAFIGEGPLGGRISVYAAEGASAAHALHSNVVMIEKAPASNPTLAEVLDRVLDKGIVIDARCDVSIAGTELITVRSHVVVASIVTYSKYFEEGISATSPRHEQVDFPAFLPDWSPFRP